MPLFSNQLAYHHEILLKQTKYFLSFYFLCFSSLHYYYYHCFLRGVVNAYIFFFSSPQCAIASLQAMVSHAFGSCSSCSCSCSSFDVTLCPSVSTSLNFFFSLSISISLL